MSAADLPTVVLTGAGLVFFCAGAAGMVRFPDTHSRLHALTKADNLGLGLVVLGVMFQADGVVPVLKLTLIWILAIVGSAIAAQIIARATLPADLHEDDD
ncbi:monovalent cation/H(+) antiporter subunit G [Tranquillimonas alkanivorans]|uniref:Multisubunit sodium/proton antiporter, MrpG subunit n=1 Tax=Tranquillimonas alkanivorans TaxID=441119 RepID=A0A1I5Q0B8_9RHOB|nr:monovalent cation/H(+) antiporter subunit G [Tranquillimonas alkanivorans]SFP39774.1 multisubunit sodium/proton antiporter, MrpG subunit [Tranquillimonas alkanivorans]